MQTSLLNTLLQTRAGEEANEILRSCVHCGFCNATCPTYQLTGNELDGPRGRIYLIKQALEGQSLSRHTQTHLDRCLSCRACETTCPSGVIYHRLLDTGREIIDSKVKRPIGQRIMRRSLRLLFPYPRRITPLLRLGQLARPFLPGSLKQAIPPYRKKPRAVSRLQHARRMLLLDGCVQPALAPRINHATTRLLDALGISCRTVPGSGCCGALSHHLSATEEALEMMRRNIDAWWPEIEAGAEAIVITASGCAPMVKEYGRLLSDDSDYAGKATRISELARDISEVISDESLEGVLKQTAAGTLAAFHSPCTLQHAQRLTGIVEKLLLEAGYELTAVADSHLCCGSAGTYSILQPAMAKQLRENKLTDLQAGGPSVIATANIGCLTHLAGGAHVPVKHWVELLEPLLKDTHD